MPPKGKRYNRKQAHPKRVMVQTILAKKPMHTKFGQRQGLHFKAVKTGLRRVVSATVQMQRQLARAQTRRAEVYQVEGKANQHVAFTYNRTKRCFQLNGETLSGLCRPLHDALLPYGTTMNAMSLALMKLPNKVGDFEMKEPGDGRRKGRFTLDPMARGRKIHAMFDTWFKSGKPVPKDGYVHCIHRALTDASLRVVETEGPVYFQALKLGSRADIVCADRQGNLWIVELKTTQTLTSKLEHPLVTFKHPFQAIPGSIMSVYYAQALATEWLFEKSRPTVRVAGCAVLLIRNDCTTRFETIPSTLRAYKEQLANAVSYQRMTSMGSGGSRHA